MIRIICGSCMILITMTVFIHSVRAQSPQATMELTGAFMSRARVETPAQIVVPTMIDVPLFFDSGAHLMALVTDHEGSIVPSKVITHMAEDILQFRVEDSFDSQSAQNMSDGAYDTYVTFPFEESVVVAERMMTIAGVADQEKRIGDREEVISSQNQVSIDLHANRVFVTDAVSFQMDEHVPLPTHIRIASIDDDGVEHIILPESFLTRSMINFPKTSLKNVRITLKYGQPLRINEITFTELGVPHTTERFVRFIAQPQKTYDVFFNATDRIHVPDQEMPNLHTERSVMIVQPQTIKTNGLYKGADADADGIVDRDDNCMHMTNGDQTDKDHNGVGDACEDFDADGVSNAQDNCPHDVNRAQADVDMDGVGDVCDSIEDRIMEKYPWIPYIALAVVFVVITMLIVKTLKKDSFTQRS